MEMRTQLLMGLEHWLEKIRMTQAEAAKALGDTQARVSDLKRGKIGFWCIEGVGVNQAILVLMGSPNEQSHRARPDLLGSPKNHF